MKYATRIALVGLAVFALPRAFTIDDSGLAGKAPDPVPPRADSPLITRPPPAAQAQLPETSDVERMKPALAEAKLVDGSVAREWGTFIEAKDIRVNCRDVQEVVRQLPRPEDYSRRCDTKTVFNHPYALFTDAQLEQIAGYDPAAAYLLAYRMLMRPDDKPGGDELEEALSYALNALVWTGEKQVFDLLINGRFFPNRMVWSTVDGIPTAPEIREKEGQYILLKAGRTLGLVPEDDFRWTLLSRVMAKHQQYFDVEALDEQAEWLSDEIAQRRSIVTGGGPF